MECRSIGQPADRANLAGNSARQSLGGANLLLARCPGAQSYESECSIARVVVNSYGGFNDLRLNHLPSRGGLASDPGNHDWRAFGVGSLCGQLWGRFYLVASNPWKRGGRPLYAPGVWLRGRRRIPWIVEKTLGGMSTGGRRQRKRRAQGARLCLILTAIEFESRQDYVNDYASDYQPSALPSDL